MRRLFRYTLYLVVAAAGLAAITPNAELLVLKQVGHIPQIEDPAQFNELLVRCVSRVRSFP